MLNMMFVTVVPSPSRVVLHVTVGSVYSLVLLVYIRDERLNPYHVFCSFFG